MATDVLVPAGLRPRRIHRAAAPHVEVSKGMALLATALCAIALLTLAPPFTRGLSLVTRAANVPEPFHTFANVGTVATKEHLVRMQLPQMSIRGRVYTPVGAARQTVLLVPGVQVAGMDDPRLVTLAHELARSQVNVLTPDIPELSQFTITAALTDRIEESALWLATQSGLEPSERIGLMGASFSGGLAIVAAGRPSLRHRVSYVFALGAHDDLPRVLEYLCTGVLPQPPALFARPGRVNVVARPHDYGVALLLLIAADRLMPPDQVEPLRDAVRRFLAASHLERRDLTRAQGEFASLRDLAEMLPEPSATLLRYVNARDVARLGRVLQPYARFFGQAPALSPARSPKPTVPVYLLHGIGDTLIPSVEAEYLAASLRGTTPVRLLRTNLISHADVAAPPHVSDVLALAAFWADLLER